MNELIRGCTLQHGKYKIVKTLGRGSFGITYLATTKVALSGGLGKMEVTVNVAIKEFFMEEFNSRSRDGSSVDGTNASLVKNYRKKFHREAENLGKLKHLNIVKVLEVFDENNTTYYAMEYVDGESLDDYIKSKGRISEREVLSLLHEIGAALKHMHDNKMLHLDLKPKNIMRNKEGHLLLIDFGLSKQYDQNGEPESSTTLGLGTPGYAPIEQANYKQDGTFPATLDIYALGATVYKMLTGSTPPHASDILSEGFPEDLFTKLGISSETISMVEKAMSPIKKQRFQSVLEVLEKIDSIGVSSKEQTAVIPSVIQEMINNMVTVEGGSFIMGSHNLGADKDERPVHRVTLHSFSIGKYQVTQEEWQAVMGGNPSFFKGKRRPVENVSWDECQLFLDKLNSLTNMEFRLPTEAEWEFAARGGNHSKQCIYAGSDNINSVAVYEKNVAEDNRNPNYGTQIVGTKAPNELGLYDMSGNVSEWCYDWKGVYGKEDVISPVGPKLGCFCVHRGGGWNSISKYCTVSSRNCDLPFHKYSNTGLRLVVGPKIQIKDDVINSINIKNALQHYIQEEEVEVIGTDEQTELKSEKLSMPDAISVSVEYGSKGYGFTFNVASDHFHTRVTASPLKCYRKGDIIEEEYFIDFDSFKTRFEKLRFLESERWEKSLNSTLTGMEATAYIRYSWNDKNLDYSRTEKSQGDGPLVKALEELLATEDVVQRVINIVKKQ